MTNWDRHRVRITQNRVTRHFQVQVEHLYPLHDWLTVDTFLNIHDAQNRLEDLICPVVIQHDTQETR